MLGFIPSYMNCQANIIYTKVGAFSDGPYHCVGTGIVEISPLDHQEHRERHT